MDLPSVINIELTNRCNLACVFCDHERLHTMMKLHSMPSVLLRRVLEGLGESRVFELGLVGLGEPLLDEQFREHLEIIQQRARQFDRISLNTNGTLLDEAAGQLILDSPINLVTISLNATNAHAYQRLMGRNLFDKTVRGIRDFILQVRTAGASLPISIQYMTSDLNTASEMDTLFGDMLSDNVIAYARKVFQKPATDTRGRGLVRVNGMGPDRHPCWSLYSRVYIDVDGNVYPCTIGNDCYRSDSALCLGNLYDHDLHSIWSGSDLATARARSEEGELAFPECEQCTLWSLFPNNFEYENGSWRLRLQDAVRRREMDRC